MSPRAALVFAIVCASLALLFTLAMAPTAWRGYRARTTYVKGMCTVKSLAVTSDTNRRGGQEFYANAELVLVVDKAAHAKTVVLGPYQTEEQARTRAGAGYAAGKSVACLYDPDDPDAIVLSPDDIGGGAAVVVPLLFDLVFGLVLVLTVRRFRRWRAGLGDG